MTKHLFSYVTIVLVLALSSCKSGKNPDLADGLYADIQTNKGDIVVKLHQEAVPLTVANFVSLAEGNSPFVSNEFKDKKYYDGLTFHRVMKDFMIQGGDPLASGTGGPGYTFKDEFVDSLKHSKKGILSMANPGPDSNGSQFFITHKPTPWLDGRHSVFGEVVKGIDVVDSIANVKTLPGDKPEIPVTMNTIDIIRKGKEARKFDAVQIMSDYFEVAEKEAAAFNQMKADLMAEFKAQEATAEQTDSGLRMVTLKEGNGEQPKVGQMVLVSYAGYLMQNGDLFDSSDAELSKKFKKYNPRRDQAGQYGPTPMKYSPDAQLAAGFREGLLTMKVGDKKRLFIPSYLGYGDNDYGPIPGGSTLVFDVEITGVQ
ncbi:Peptidyl-prolyl cis-trans isomerase [Croceitalea dokdonensis DOKDO 023]|uniref:peptidylprolyl isomerase n=1 Tax=Croceitalea dokdonensis DOKDO 023 TaxID=1300341 RepID=A0A0P7AIS2_9FLAO|nr:peptidylprolyl isomerase [Croceitalea dokdonensis]KPM31695.1 Peptidyl-prolyl cis-trans isomerase [Croceitalea dokdonensis DOKDO 023]